MSSRLLPKNKVFKDCERDQTNLNSILLKLINDSGEQKLEKNGLNRELSLLGRFNAEFSERRSFCEDEADERQSLFVQLLKVLTRDRLANADWLDGSGRADTALAMLTALRILLRDETLQHAFVNAAGIRVLSEALDRRACDHMTVDADAGDHSVDHLKELTNMCQKLAAVEDFAYELYENELYKSLLLLLASSDRMVLHCSLYALIALCQHTNAITTVDDSSKSTRLALSALETSALDQLLQIVASHDADTRKLAVQLLCHIVAEPEGREALKVYDGVTTLLSLLHLEHRRLLWYVTRCLTSLCADSEIQDEIRQAGGIPLLLSLLQSHSSIQREKSMTSPQASPIQNFAANSANWGGARHLVVPPIATPQGGLQGPMFSIAEEPVNSMAFDASPTTSAVNLTSMQTAAANRDQDLSLKCMTCAVLSELATNYGNAQQIVANNGVYTLASLILPLADVSSEQERLAAETLQRGALRVLRFLFSSERHRRYFKRLFPSDALRLFIDIGHFNHASDAYQPLIDHINAMQADKLADLRDSVAMISQTRPIDQYISDYAVLEVLGSGAFGCVYRVRKELNQSGGGGSGGMRKDAAAANEYALKEISLHNPAFGRSTRDRDRSVADVICELGIIREQLRHDNVVRYYKTFVEGGKLYILMELIDGAPLMEHFNSLREKRERFAEPRVWNIFLQIVLALRYLHKQKRVVHRDLTPNNVLIGEADKVTITDFGLAKIKQSDASKMMSVCGTMLYSCPEMIKNEPYDEKADVWSAGCLLYQMARLEPPFYSGNMLSLATKIVEAQYEPIPVRPASRPVSGSSDSQCDRPVSDSTRRRLQDASNRTSDESLPDMASRDAKPVGDSRENSTTPSASANGDIVRNASSGAMSDSGVETGSVGSDFTSDLRSSKPDAKVYGNPGSRKSSLEPYSDPNTPTQDPKFSNNPPDGKPAGMANSVTITENMVNATVGKAGKDEEGAQYSALVGQIVALCLQVDASQRPDSVQLVALLAEKFVHYMESLRAKNHKLEQRLRRERHHSQRHQLELSRSQRFLRTTSTVDSGRSSRLLSSGGAISIREDDTSDGFSEGDFSADSSRLHELRRGVADTGAPASRNRPISLSSDGHTSTAPPAPPPLNQSLVSPMHHRGTPGAHCSGANHDDSANLPRPPSDKRSPNARKKQPDSQRSPKRPLFTRLEVTGKSLSEEATVASSAADSANNSPANRRRLNDLGRIDSLENLKEALRREKQLTLKERADSCGNFRPESRGRAAQLCVDVNNNNGAASAVGRSHSTSHLNARLRATIGLQCKPRSTSAVLSANTVSVSPRKVRQINDPVLQLLTALHKLVFISQLPPSLAPDPRRLILDKYKRSLFAPATSPLNLKSELTKLCAASAEPLETHLTNVAELARQLSSTSSDASAEGPSLTHDTSLSLFDPESGQLTYEALHTLCEAVLLDNGYYQMAPRPRALFDM